MKQNNKFIHLKYSFTISNGRLKPRTMSLLELNKLIKKREQSFTDTKHNRKKLSTIVESF